MAAHESTIWMKAKLGIKISRSIGSPAMRMKRGTAMHQNNNITEANPILDRNHSNLKLFSSHEIPLVRCAPPRDIYWQPAQMSVTVLIISGLDHRTPRLWQKLNSYQSTTS